MGMPGLTAETSVYRSPASYRAAAPGPASPGITSPHLVSASAARSPIGSRAWCAAECARMANECTYGCSGPSCRDRCNDYFWRCLDGCDVFGPLPPVGGVFAAR
jgi:hypothetical protein